ncbi:MAG: hypothetical protein ACRDDW_04915 [Candidatus Rhabdochlamydia sp.]
MNKLLKAITACFVLPASFLCAGLQEVQDEKQNDSCCVENSFGYLNIGAEESLLGFVPFLGFGYRTQKDHHGFNVSGSMGHFQGQTTARLGALYNYFFKPNPEAQFFAGLGLEAKGINECNGYVVVRPILAVGQEFRSKTGFQHIIQLQVAWLPICDFFAYRNSQRLYFCECIILALVYIYPEVVVSYGFGF